jgi:hypothetical protein
MDGNIRQASEMHANATLPKYFISAADYGKHVLDKKICEAYETLEDQVKSGNYAPVAFHFEEELPPYETGHGLIDRVTRDCDNTQPANFEYSKASGRLYVESTVPLEKMNVVVAQKMLGQLTRRPYGKFRKGKILPMNELFSGTMILTPIAHNTSRVVTPTSVV